MLWTRKQISGRGVVEAGEGRHLVHQLLNHQGHHVGVQGLDEALHSVGEVLGQGLHVAQGE